MSVQGIHLAWVVVNDLNKALKFYTESLGFKLLEHQADYGWAEVSGSSGARLGIAQASACSEEDSDLGTMPGINAVVAITVDNIDKTIAAYKAKGVKLIGKKQEVPGQVVLQTLEDPDGNKFQLAQLLK